MQTIAHIPRDATIDWDKLADPDQRLLEDCGDIVLNLLDVWDPTRFFIDQVLERWADGWRFSLAGIPSRMPYTRCTSPSSSRPSRTSCPTSRKPSTRCEGSRSTMMTSMVRSVTCSTSRSG